MMVGHFFNQWVRIGYSGMIMRTTWIMMSLVVMNKHSIEDWPKQRMRMWRLLIQSIHSLKI